MGPRDADRPRVVVADEGSHGDHWSAVFGFDDPEHVEASVHGLMDGLRRGVDLRRNALRVERTDGVLSTLGIFSRDGLDTLYPCLDATATVPVRIGEVVEWGKPGALEGQVRGAGHDTFAVDFFAVDFAEQKRAYARGGTRDIALAGLAYVIDAADDDGDEPGSEFIGYLPNPDFPCGHDFEFVGEVVGMEDVHLLSEVFLLLDVRLIRHPEHPDLFTLPLLVNRKNMRIVHCDVGERITGCFWLHGYLLEA